MNLSFAAQALEAREVELAVARDAAAAAEAERDELRRRLDAASDGDGEGADPRVGERTRRVLRHLDAARGAALLAAAVAADATADETLDGRMPRAALGAAEDHLRTFAASAVDFAAVLAAASAPPPPAALATPAPAQAAPPDDDAANAARFSQLADHLARCATSPVNSQGSDRRRALDLDAWPSAASSAKTWAVPAHEPKSKAWR